MVMEVFHIKQSSDLVLNDSVCAIGFFDGLHLGHQELLKRVEKLSNEFNLKKALMTFSSHPKSILGNEDVKYLMSLDDKIKILENRGFDYLFIIDFNIDIANMLPEDFINDFLINNHIKHIVCGFDFHFGKKGIGSAKDFIEDDRLEVDVIDKYVIDDLKVSSSLIKELLLDGKIDKANYLLSRPYSITGEVIYGLQNGRKIGFPTANIKLNDYVPLKRGVYGVYLLLDNKKYLAMANIGLNPTVGKIDCLSLEVNIFDFDEDIYGKEVTVNFIFRVRDEKCFSSLDELKKQLHIDKEYIKECFD